jgi:Zn-dependent protease with chaperone function
MTTEHVYPAGPSTIPSSFTRSTRRYHLHAWLAMGGLLLFVALYLGLASWFTWAAYRLIVGMTHGGDAFWSVIVGTSCGFLAVFMWKALFFFQRHQGTNDIEVTAQEQPRLFAFINKLADEAGAPRAHRVFLSARVNAAVFYDLTVLNLLFPSRKNLEIGLGLVNSLSLGELKAVLAHEFGHFAQRSMAVGRWVYIAQQIAGRIISKRDALDGFLRGLSRFDLRVAWVGWVLSTVVWSIRSLMETVFRIVVLAQRALSREMELQADLVAVSLTGSDALIHALYRLQVADEAWERTLAFANSEAHSKRGVGDLFAVQKHITSKLREVLDNPHYGDVEPVPSGLAAEHRLFKTALGQPPRMWSTHPANSEREDNAKRIYVHAPIDERTAWELFDDVPNLARQLSAQVFHALEDAETVPLDASLAKLDEQYGRAYYDRSYRGAYLGRALAQHARDVADLYGPALRSDFVDAELDSIYPPSLSQDLARLRALEEEQQTLRGLKEGFLTAPGGIIRYRGRELRQKDLQIAVDEVTEEIERARTIVFTHDRRCRSVHLAAASQLGSGWDEYLKGLLAIIHYAEHNEANLRDAHGALNNTMSIVLADGRVSGTERKRLLDACAEVHNALRHIYEDEGKLIALDRTLLRRLKIESWQAALGTFNLPLASDENLGEWLNAIDSWVWNAAATLSSLRQASLEQLLLVEGQVARFVREKMTPGPAPAATTVPHQYPLLVPGSERPRQRRLDLWDRFHVADGLVFTLARLTVACGIIAVVLNVGVRVGASLVNVYNGLGRPVTVTIGRDSVALAPFSHAALTLGDEEHYNVKATTGDGDLIEQFDVEIPLGSAKSVYNVAAATSLVEWVAVYGAAQPSRERMVGPTRWTTTDASFIFEEPPEKISGSGDGGTRRVISAFGHDNPGGLLQALADNKEREIVINAHARWDASDSPHTAHWLALAARGASFEQIIEARLRLQHDDVLALRAEQDYAKPGMRSVVCSRHRSMAESRPASVDLQYIATRCIDDDVRRDQAFEALYVRAPDHGWSAMATAYTYMQQARWQAAVTPLDAARANLPSLRDSLAIDTARVRRMLSTDGDAQTSDLVPHSQALKYFMAVKSGAGMQPGTDMAYYHLGRGAPDLAAREIIEAPSSDKRVLRFAAASDGASEATVQAALALPITEGIDTDSVWTALALALREKKDPSAYLSTVRSYADDDSKQLLEFIAAIRTSANPSEEERRLDGILNGLDVTARGHAYSAALVLLGNKAPEAWRRSANRLLFIPERPYFNSAPRANMTQIVVDEPGIKRTPPRLVY